MYEYVFNITANFSFYVYVCTFEYFHLHLFHILWNFHELLFYFFKYEWVGYVCVCSISILVPFFSFFDGCLDTTAVIYLSSQQITSSTWLFVVILVHMFCDNMLMKLGYGICFIFIYFLLFILLPICFLLILPPSSDLNIASILDWRRINCRNSHVVNAVFVIRWIIRFFIK